MFKQLQPEVLEDGQKRSQKREANIGENNA
jgi:hypothetical protein